MFVKLFQGGREASTVNKESILFTKVKQNIDNKGNNDDR